MRFRATCQWAHSSAAWTADIQVDSHALSHEFGDEPRVLRVGQWSRRRRPSTLPAAWFIQRLSTWRSMGNLPWPRQGVGAMLILPMSARCWKVGSPMSSRTSWAPRAERGGPERSGGSKNGRSVPVASGKASDGAALLPQHPSLRWANWLWLAPSPSEARGGQFLGWQLHMRMGRVRSRYMGRRRRRWCRFSPMRHGPRLTCSSQHSIG